MTLLAPETPNLAPPAYPISSVDNALRLLLALRERRSLRLSEASAVIGCGRSTAHRLLAMLSYHGFVVQDPATRVYSASPALCASREDADLELEEIVRPILAVVARATGETAHAAELRGQTVRFFASVETERDVRTGSRRGVSYPAHCTSGGKALLAAMTPDEVDDLYSARPPEKLTPASIGSLPELHKHLACVRARGYAINVGESQPGVFALAVAVKGGGDLPRIALAVSGPRNRLGDASVEPLAQTVTRAADLLHRRLVERLKMPIRTAAQPSPPAELDSVRRRRAMQ